MKRLSFCFLTLFSLLSAMGQQMLPVPGYSTVKFRIKNLGISITGSFGGLKGTIRFDPASPEAAYFLATVDASSINTGIDLRDNHLKKEEYFDVAGYPVLSFESTRVTGSGKKGTYRVFGKLTIKGISRDLDFPFTATARDGGYLFEGEFKINRRDFRVGGSSFTLSDNLTVNLSVLAKTP